MWSESEAHWGERQASVRWRSLRPEMERHFQLTSSCLPYRITEWQEAPDQLQLHSGSICLDATFSLAIHELALNRCEQINDPAYNDGHPLKCSVYITGEKWPFIWTRDTAYAVDLGLYLLDAQRSKRSLAFKCSAKRLMSPHMPLAGKEIIQDTGSGGSWPVSSDRVVWAIGAQRLLGVVSESEAQSWRQEVFGCLKQTVESDRLAVFDADEGLYRGEQSFLDWRQQSYPPYTSDNVRYIADSYALSTNLLHMMALDTLQSLATDLGQSLEADKYRAWFEALKQAVPEKFWSRDFGFYAAIRGPAPHFYLHDQSDLLALSLMSRLYQNDARLRESLMKHPLGKWGPPVIFPFYEQAPIYHNQAVWPFVSAYYLRALRNYQMHHHFLQTFESLVAQAFLHHSHMENYEVLTGQEFFEDGIRSGPVVNSRRQLWSIAGFAGMILEHVIGLCIDSQGRLSFTPFVSQSLMRRWQLDQGLQLKNWVWLGKKISVRVHFDPVDEIGEYAYKVRSWRLNHQERSIDQAIDPSELKADNDIELWLSARACVQSLPEPIRTLPEMSSNQLEALQRHQLFAPKTPEVRILGQGRHRRLDFGTDHEDRHIYQVIKNGQLLASALGEPWFRIGDYYDPALNCYQVVRCDCETGLHSHPSQAVCLACEVQQLRACDGRLRSLDHACLIDRNGRVYFSDWGRPDQVLVAPLGMDQSGLFGISIEYANAHAPMTTGMTSVNKAVILQTASETQVIGIACMPQQSRWDQWHFSNEMRVELAAGKTYILRVEDFFNMSYLAASEHYTAFAGGKSGALNRAHIAGIRVRRLAETKQTN